MKNLKLVVTLIIVLAAGAARANLIDVYATSFPGGNPSIEVVNLSNGSAIPIGTVKWGGILNDIAQDPIGGALYGLSGANLFTISTIPGSAGKVTPVVVSGMNGSMETLAFDSQGNLFIGTQSSLYEVNGGAAVFIGNYGSAPYLNSAGQNIRFEGNTLYLANTGSGNNTELYSISTNSGVATFIGVITNQPSVVLGNAGGHIYGSSVPAINGGAAHADLLDFGATITTYLGRNPLGSGEIQIVNYTTVNNTFPMNVNFSAAGSVAAVPEPNICLLLGLGIITAIAVRYRKTKMRGC